MKWTPAIFACLVGLAAAEDELNAEWLAKDLEVSKRVVAAMPPGDLPVAEFLAKLGDGESKDEQDIGFGARRISLALSGGYTTVYVTIVAHGDRLGPVLVRCYQWEPETWALIRDSIVPAWKSLNPRIDETGLQVESGSLSQLEKFNEERARLLGAPPEPKTPPELAEARNLLWSPMRELHYGQACGYGGEPPEGRNALEKIFAHKEALPVLLDILRGPNPVGRVYAAEALLRLQKKGAALPDDAAKAVAWVRTAPTPVEICHDCLHSTEAAGETLDLIVKAAKD